MQRTTDELVNDCGGDEALAKKCHKHRTTVNNWRRTGIPEGHWVTVAALSKATIKEIFNANRIARGEAPVKAIKGRRV